MKHIFALAVLLSLGGLSSPFPNGAPEKACEDLVPSPTGHKASPSNKTCPYVFTSEVVEDTLMLKIEGVPPFRGFAIQVRYSSNNALAGEFSWDEDETEHVKYMKCDPDNPRSSITQSKARAREHLVVFWSWPDTISAPQDGDYKITYAAVADKKLFWVKTILAEFAKKS